MPKNILFVSFYYPPAGGVGLPGAQRAVKFIRHFKNPTVVLSVKPEDYGPYLAQNFNVGLPVNKELIYRTPLHDYFSFFLKSRSLIRRILKRGSGESSLPENNSSTKTDTSGHPVSQKSERSFAQQIKDFIYDLCYFPDPASGWIFPAVLAGRKIIREQKIDVIFATGMPWSCLVIAWLLHKLTKVPFVVDFRDPWIGNPFHQSKGFFLDGLNRRLEKAIIASAALVSANTEPLRQEMIVRYPSVPSGKFIVLPNGYDPSDFVDILTEKNAKPPESDDRLLIVHAGYLYGQRDPAPLVEALVELRRRYPSVGKKIQFIQIGDVHLDYDFRTRFAELIENGGVVLVDSLPYHECLLRQSAADVLVLIQPGTKTQVPSKLYDYLCLNRPILTITPLDGALGQMVKTHGFGDVFEPQDLEGIIVCLHELWKRKCEQKSLQADYPAKVHFSVDKITDILESHLATLA